MGFFSRKSKAAEPVASDFGNDATKRLASVEEDLKAANLKVELLTGQLADANHNVNQGNLKVDVLTGQLADANHALNQVRAELERFNVAEATKQMDPDDARTELNHQIKVRDDKISQLKKELDSMTTEMNDQMQQLNKKMMLVMDEKDYQIKRLNALGANDGQDKDNLRTGISAETGRKLPDGKLPVIEKSESERKIIESALMANAFMRGLSRVQFDKIIDAMEKKTYKAKVELIRQGQDGKQMYVLEKGQVAVSKGIGEKERQHVCDLGPGTLFGELAILYNCRRTATITSKTDLVVWSLERVCFQTVVRSAGQEKDQERYEHVKKVKDLKDLPEVKLRKICDCLEEESFDDGSCIIRQGTRGDLFFIIKSGDVRITIDETGGEKEVATKHKGDYFGEIALIREDVRSANVYASGSVVCYTLDRTAFTSLVGKIQDEGDDKGDEVTDEPKRVIHELVKTAELKDLEIVKALGAGGLGLVKLVRVKGITDRGFALKCIQKCRVVQYGQQRHIMDEKKILLAMQSPFILGLLRTFKDKKFVYLLTDAYLGGDLWSTIHSRGPFNDAIGRFYVACVVEAFDYLHKRHFCYRDLKPENLMVDNNGYVRLVDLGFAKLVPPGHKTWTFCGTPEYIPPEIISNTGHNVSADYWSLGILIFELLSQKTPFRAKDDMAIYDGILRGIHSVQFPDKISRKAESLIKKLCRQDPSERIGYQKAGCNDIRKHRWFQGFDWEGLQAEKIQAPFIPVIKNPFDTANFEKIREEDERKIPEETSGWDDEF